LKSVTLNVETLMFYRMLGPLRPHNLKRFLSACLFLRARLLMFVLVSVCAL
jgi:hypothetical protein